MTSIEHQSFVCVSFNHTQGGRQRLFGSHLESHSQTVVLRIAKARLEVESSGHQNIFPGKTLCEVILSPAQFAQLLTTMNVYSGVPGTLRAWEGKEVPGPPAESVRSEAATIRENFKTDVLARLRELRKSLAGAHELVSLGRTLTKKQMSELLTTFERYAQSAESDIPWFLSQFQEATEKVVTSAKAEIDAFALSEIVQAGIKLAQERLSVPALNAPEPASVPITDASWIDPASPQLPQDSSPDTEKEV